MAYSCPAGVDLLNLRRQEMVLRNWSRDAGGRQARRYQAHKLTMSSKMIWAQMAKDNRLVCRNHLGLVRYGGRFGQTMEKRVVEEDDDETVAEEEEDESVAEEADDSVAEEEDESVAEDESVFDYEHAVAEEATDSVAEEAAESVAYSDTTELYEINTIAELDSDFNSIHSGLSGVDSIQWQLYLGYQWLVYKVDENDKSVEYAPASVSSTGTAGINLSHIMQKILGEDSETSFHASLSDSTDYDDIEVYIVATHKITGDHYTARVSNTSPGFDEMNPWYWNNKVTSSSLASLASGKGSGALPSESLQSKIRDNISDSTSTLAANFQTIYTDVAADTDAEHEAIAIYTHSDVLSDHYFYFAIKTAE